MNGVSNNNMVCNETLNETRLFQFTPNYNNIALSKGWLFALYSLERQHCDPRENKSFK